MRGGSICSFVVIGFFAFIVGLPVPIITIVPTLAVVTTLTRPTVNYTSD
jgi:hypothetical protein